jgi:hypothetical protein
VSAPAAKQPPTQPPAGFVERLRRVTWSRVWFMVGLLVIGLVLVRVLGRTTPSVNKSEAVQISRPHIDFNPDGHQIRYVRRGIPPHGFWIVSWFIRKEGGGYTRVTVVVVDASNGNVTEVRRTA